MCSMGNEPSGMGGRGGAACGLRKLYYTNLSLLRELSFARNGKLEMEILGKKGNLEMEILVGGKEIRKNVTTTPLSCIFRSSLRSHKLSSKTKN
jgi:hypothetical protein